MTDKMREDFGKWLVQRRLGRFADFNGNLIDCTVVFWEAWQAAQSVPVVGEVVAEYGFISDGQGTGTGTYGFWQIGNPNLAMGTKLIVQPTHSISAAELERLRKDAELKASESSIACEALQSIIDLLPDSGVAQAKLIAIAAMTKRAAIAAEGEK